jgi:hypothetical protein
LSAELCTISFALVTAFSLIASQQQIDRGDRNKWLVCGQMRQLACRPLNELTGRRIRFGNRDQHLLVRALGN